MSAPIKPLADYVVLAQEEAEARTASGLYLVDKSQERPKVAKVVAVGKEVKELKVGDRVVYGGYSNSEIKIEGKEYLLVKEENVFATLGK